MAQDFQTYLSGIRQQIEDVSAFDLNALLSTPDRTVTLIDVREQNERDDGFISGSKHLSRSFLEIKIESEVVDKDADIIIYCQSGTRSLLACKTLQSMGYQKCRSLTGGFLSWKAAGYTVQSSGSSVDLTYMRKRYSRHLFLPEVGESGQRALLDASVLIIGAGGLGSPIALYLAAAGVGKLGIVDHDIVEESNLQRQVLHCERTVGIAKVESAAAAIRNLNSRVIIETFREQIDTTNASRIISNFDIVIDGTDNFRTRYTVNDACVRLSKPLIYGAIFRFDGQVSVFVPRCGPCYRCLFPEVPSAAIAPSCAESGVLGVLPGTIGLLMATECIKMLLSIGKSLVGRLLIFDALSMDFNTLTIPRDPSCICCSDGVITPEDLPRTDRLS